MMRAYGGSRMYGDAMKQVVVTIDGRVEVGDIVGKYRSHGPVLPVSMMQHAHRIIR